MAGVVAQAHARLRETGLAATACNALIRHLGRVDLLSDVFALLDSMRAAKVKPDAETWEFVANAAVKEVAFECSAVSMKTLPPPGPPEILFVGRSNVGKSSLVNMLVNRKAIAPTSSKPGFTTELNFYSVNAGRKRGLRCRLVDVPGLGFAEADAGRVDSWRSTLQRYLAVRAPLRCAFHLIDARDGPQRADRDLMAMAAAAAAESGSGGSGGGGAEGSGGGGDGEGGSSGGDVDGSAEGSGGAGGSDYVRRQPPAYVIVLTKADRVAAPRLQMACAEAAAAAAAAGLGGDVPVLVSSSKTRTGRDVLWRRLYDVLGEQC
ncbi:P-loop containing nucleoside triphosphate hydrolase protein [Tribonema minus]|uniref:P-loop containing nucleoside triphosphate hydrolase protein n=1 Tax=Tribonema minus TaxID=303371 RepID=A0A836C7W4_9STRA|nr:P-loop containing nucleoside triphosphate hydrolase protein [Tribonema minus]